MTAPFRFQSQWGTLRATEEVVLRGGDSAPLHDWRADRFASADEFRFWARHVCGLACLRSVLGSWHDTDVALAELLRGALREGALVLHTDGTVGGLYYRPFLEWVGTRFGMNGEVVERTPVAELVGRVDDDTVAIVSVSPEIRWPQRANERRGGHLVLVYGGSEGMVEFHNPSGVTGSASAVRLDIDTFSRFAAGRGMLLRRVSSPALR